MRQPKNKRPTQRTIAEKAGVSVGAVSRALANDPMMAEETRRLVHRIAQDLGYVPDRAAQRLRTGRTNVIGLILPPHDEILEFGTSIVRGISEALLDSPYHLVVMPDFSGDGADDTIRRVVRNQLADGVILSRTQPQDARIKYLLEAEFPFVTHGRSELATPHSYVDYDNAQFACHAARMLINSGARKLALLLPVRKFTFASHLQQGFMTAVRESGVAHAVINGVNIDSDAKLLESELRTLLTQEDAPDGLVLPGETSGIAALAAIQDLGLVPGKDVRIVVKQTAGIFDSIRPRTPSIGENLLEAGQLMAQLLLRQIAGEPAADLQYVQPAIIDERYIVNP
ncbi:LacI family transcriptional regulator [Shimia abyssi]|uniref:LacI family transcriptional regulator n=1 Tax=Shimia abyssi TaxID=1662395 RepID=A0A2P8FC87_9RHOB|nr:LacI family transcriptional regulator [Shimia abyssi]PSL19341.1 LacI family transcriptional regulator [Shimia abyssi]